MLLAWTTLPALADGQGGGTEADLVNEAEVASWVALTADNTVAEATTASASYSSAISVDKTTTIKAIAVKEGYGNSEVAEAMYTITEPELYDVTVNNGTGDGNYVEGASVTVTANAPEQGKKFKEWTATGITLTDEQKAAASLTFTMPAHAVEVTATYEDIPPAHTHSWTYSADGATITARCGGEGTCDIASGLTMTISAADSVYDGQQKTASLSAGYNSTAFPGSYAIQYYKANADGSANGSALSNPPTEVGKYRAEVAAGTGEGAKTAHVLYEITPADNAQTTVKAHEGVPEMQVTGLTRAVAESHMTQEEKARVEAGEVLQVYLEISNIDGSVSDADRALVTAAANKLDSDAKIAQYLDMSLFKQTGNAAAKPISSPTNPLTVKTPVPADKRKAGRRFFIVRVHDGAAEIIAQGSEEYIDCQSNLFSTYALAYVDAADPYIPPSPPTPATITIPVSGDAATVNLTVQVSGTTATITGADVDANGTITAVGEGSTILYAYAQNGLYKTVTVTVTPGQIVRNSAEEPETEEDALQIDSLTAPDVDGGEIVLDDAIVEDEIIDSMEIEADIIPEDDAAFID